MATVPVSTFAEFLDAAVTSAVNGNIVEMATGTYTATVDVTITKNITIHFNGNVTLDMDSNTYDFAVRAQSGGTTFVCQRKPGTSGTFTIDNADSACLKCQSLNGPLTATLRNIDFAASAGASSGGLLVFNTDAGKHNITVSCYNCDASDHAGSDGDGFDASNNDTAGSSTVTMNLYDCTSNDIADANNQCVTSHGDGYGCTVNVVRGNYGPSADDDVFGGDGDVNVVTIDGVTASQDNANHLIGGGVNETTIVRNSTLTHSGAGSILNVGGAGSGSQLVNNCTLSHSGTGQSIQAAQDNSLELVDSSITNSGAGNCIFISGTGTYTLRNSSITNSGNTIGKYTINSNNASADIVSYGCSFTSTGLPTILTFTNTTSAVFWNSTFTSTVSDVTAVVGRTLVFASTNSELTFNKCIFDFSDTGMTDNVQMLGVRGLCHLEGCLIKGGEGFGALPLYLTYLSSGSSIKGTTVYGINTLGSSRGIQALGPVTAVGNLLANLDIGVAASDANYNQANGGNNGENFIDADTDFSGGSSAQGSDITAGSQSFVNAPTDLRLAATGDARGMVTQDQYRIPSYPHSVSVVGSGDVNYFPNDSDYDDLPLDRDSVNNPSVGTNLDAGCYRHDPYNVTLTSGSGFGHWGGNVPDISEQVSLTTPVGSRGTLLTFNGIKTNSNPITAAETGSIKTITAYFQPTQTRWNIIMENGDEFVMVTTATGSDSPNILDADLWSLDIWLPPLNNFRLRVQQNFNGTYTPWTSFASLTSKGFVNSFENYAILNANTLTISG